MRKEKQLRYKNRTRELFPDHFVSNDVKIRVPRSSGCARAHHALTVETITGGEDKLTHWAINQVLSGGGRKKKGIRGEILN